MTRQAQQRTPPETALDAIDRKLIRALQRGLPLVARPYRELAQQLGIAEPELLARVEQLHRSGAIKRMGVVVRHRPLGYRANAMVVWDVPDPTVSALGRCLSGFDFVTLCYQRPRHAPDWPYNLFCMIHGRDRDAVTAKVAFLVSECGLESIPHAVLFSRRCFKQRGARYRAEEVRP